MRLFSDSIGRKAVMAVTGLLMVLFVIGHLLGNLTIFAGPNGINAYAERLHALAPVVWGTRIVMGVAVLLHVFLSIQITLENSAAKPDKLRGPELAAGDLRQQDDDLDRRPDGAPSSCYHLLQFTFRVTPGLVLGSDVAGPVRRLHDGGRPPSRRTVTALVYVAAMVSLFLHLSHGIQSAFQTLGLSNAMLLPRYGVAGKVLSGIFLIGFGAIPALILAGILAK